MGTSWVAVHTHILGTDLILAVAIVQWFEGVGLVGPSWNLLARDRECVALACARIAPSVAVGPPVGRRAIRI